MKRGLKVVWYAPLINPLRVATYAPMKRGLKGLVATPKKVIVNSSNLCPDEKGTESKVGCATEIPDQS